MRGVCSPPWFCVPEQLRIKTERLDLEGAIESRAVVLHRDRRCQFDELLVAEVAAGLGEVGVRDFDRRLGHGLGQNKGSALRCAEQVARAEFRDGRDLGV